MEPVTFQARLHELPFSFGQPHLQCNQNIGINNCCWARVPSLLQVPDLSQVSALAVPPCMCCLYYVCNGWMTCITNETKGALCGHFPCLRHHLAPLPWSSRCPSVVFRVILLAVRFSPHMQALDSILSCAPSLEAGVPQDIVLGPFLFLVNIKLCFLRK